MQSNNNQNAGLYGLIEILWEEVVVKFVLKENMIVLHFTTQVGSVFNSHDIISQLEFGVVLDIFVFTFLLLCYSSFVIGH